MSREDLASFYVNTPDPLLNDPPMGQRLMISWCIPRKYAKYRDLHLVLTIRYRNREEEVKTIEIKKTSGSYIYHLLNEKYCEKGSILTYKVALIGCGHILEEWYHQLWAELILFEDENKLER